MCVYVCVCVSVCVYVCVCVQACKRASVQACKRVTLVRDVAVVCADVRALSVCPRVQTFFVSRHRETVTLKAQCVRSKHPLP